MTPVTSVNNIGSETEFIHRGNRIDPWGTTCFNVSQSEKKF
jgi:hypothetical protein